MVTRYIFTILQRHSRRVFSSEGASYCWRFSFCRLEDCPCAPYRSLGGGTLPDFKRTPYIRGFVGSRPSPSTALAVSILCDHERWIDHKVTLEWAGIGESRLRFQVFAVRTSLVPD